MSCCDLLSEIESSVLTALERGDGVVPGYTGTSPRETEEPVTYAVTQALTTESVMDLLLAYLKTDAGAVLRKAIATDYAEWSEDGIREAREGAAQEDWLERDVRGVFA